MTYYPFNVHRVIMAAARVKQQAKATSKPDVEALEKILDGIIVAVGKQKEKYHKYVTTALEQGMEPKEIFNLAKEKLRDYVSVKTIYNWTHELVEEGILPEEAFDSTKQRAANLSHDRYKGAVNLQQAIQEHIEHESCPEAYEIDKVKSGVYTYEYLQQLCIWLHDTLELNCRGK